MERSAGHPIGDEFLIGYAAGLLPEAYDLMVATAVSLDDEARARLEGFESMGGVFLEEVEVAPLRDDSFDAVMARISGEDRADPAPSDPAPSDPAPSARAPSPTGTTGQGAVLPQPLREALGGDIDALRWRGIGMGVKQVVLEDRDGQATARLLSIPGGQAMPDHGHNGTEITLVLKGAFLDGDRRYARGDVEVADDAVQHMPVADIGEECICLVVTDAPLRFNKLIPRIAQRFLNI